MSEITASANLDWGWIELVGLGLLCPLLVIIGSTSLLHHWRKRRLRGDPLKRVPRQEVRASITRANNVRHRSSAASSH